jgi:amino acid transporter
MEKSKQEASTETSPVSKGDEDLAQGSVADITSGSQSLHRSLRGKEVQLFAIGGAIGTCMLAPGEASSVWGDNG